jgi:hypothetical protein
LSTSTFLKNKIDKKNKNAKKIKKCENFGGRNFFASDQNFFGKFDNRRHRIEKQKFLKSRRDRVERKNDRARVKTGGQQNFPNLV